jgi:hypothetical protein
MNMRLLFVFGVACSSVAGTAAAESFTREQRQEIARLLDAERTRVIAEVARELDARGVTLDTGKVLQHVDKAAKAETRKVPEEAAADGDYASAPDTIDPFGGVLGVTAANRAERKDASVIQIDTSNKGTEATLSVSTPNVIDYSNGRFRQTSWSVTASAPLSDDGYGVFADLNGLSGGFGLKVDWTRTVAPFNQESAQHVINYCRSLHDNNDILQGCSGESPAIQLKRVKWRDLDYDQQIALRQALDKTRGTVGRAYVYSFGGGVDHDEYKYLSLPNVKHVDRKIGWNARGSWGVVTADRQQYWGAGFVYDHGYKAADPRVVCTPTGEPTFDCIDARFAPPKDEISRVLYAEMRSSAFERPYSIRVSHDLANDANAVDVPIYLIAAKDTGFTGGVRLGWQTDEKFIAGIFVGAAFDVWP